jgi:hypothetical protein
MGEKVNIFEERNIKVFNSSLEIGLRTLFLLAELSPNGCDLQRLVYYDYLLIHSGDVPNGPQSIHPQIPHRSTEILVKRELVKNGLTLMNSKQLIEAKFDIKGIVYYATSLTTPFLQYHNSEYANALRTTAKWVISAFDSYSDKKLEKYISNNLDVWGGEFAKESLFRGGIE